MGSALAGFGFGLSLIVAIGAQNAFVLRQGLLRRHVGLVVAICALSDALLIIAGIAGMGGFLDAAPALRRVLLLAGAAFLLAYSFLAARRALHPDHLDPEAAASSQTARAAAITCLALTWLNPHVYLDTVLLLGSVAHSQDSPGAFGVGAATGSVVWFAALGYGARWLRPLFAKDAAWRVLDVVIALVMLGIGLSLLHEALA